MRRTERRTSGAHDPHRTGLFEDAWSLLNHSTAQQESPLRAPVLATVDLTGNPNARTVVLHRVDSKTRTIYLNTDRRSAKYQELRRLPKAMLVFHDAEGGLQLRLRCNVALHENDALTHQAWEGLSMAERSLYMTEAAPGEPALAATSGLPPTFHSHNPGTDDLARGYSNLCLLELTAQNLDWLHYDNAQTRRARFDWSGGPLTATWVFP